MSSSPLFNPIDVGALHAANRIWLSPLTRSRATREHVPTKIMIEYYTQRAGAGLLISEGVGISQEGLGFAFAPGLWTQEQINAWKPITKAVHDKGSPIIAQLWHLGRAAHPSISGMRNVSSSATSYPFPQHTYEGVKQPEVARPLTIPEIQATAKDYGTAAKNAIEAGFDGVEIQGGNGYLIDQFLRDNSNKRTDEYGGSVENRIRFLDDVLREVTGAIGGPKTGIRLSPNGDTQGVDDSNPEALYSEVAKMLNKYDLAFVELREVGPNGTMGSTDVPKLHPTFRKYYKGNLVLNQDYNRVSAEEALNSGIADAIVFGRPFISNPDLVEKIRHKDDEWAPHGDFSTRTWYGQGGDSVEGYTDFPIKYKS